MYSVDTFSRWINTQMKLFHRVRTRTFHLSAAFNLHPRLRWCWTNAAFLGGRLIELIKHECQVVDFKNTGSDLKNTHPRFIFNRKGTRGTTCHVQYLYQICLEKSFSSEVNRYIHIHGTVALWRKPLRKPPRRKPLSRMMKIAAGSRSHLAGSLSYSFAILSAFTSRLRNAFRTIIRFRNPASISRLSRRSRMWVASRFSRGVLAR